MPQILNACTVDIEDYYHVSAFDELIPRSQWASQPSRVEQSTRTILSILFEAGVKATFFILGAVAQRHPRLIREICAAGHELGCHSDEHRLVYTMTPEEFRADLRRAKRRLEDLSGSPVYAYRAPSFSIIERSTWALAILAREGFRIDSSIYPIHHDRYGMPGAPTAPYILHTDGGSLTEFPPTTISFFGVNFPAAGGGYFRLYPYWLTDWAMRRTAALGRPVNLYVHPWEFDPDQPRVAGVKAFAAFRQYVNLEGNARKFAWVLTEHRFGSITKALAAMGTLPERRLCQGRIVAAHPQEALLVGSAT